MAEPNKKLHVAMFPWLAFGHIIPFLELSKLIAKKGHHISFISTPRNIKRLPRLPPDVEPLIDLVKLPLPHEANLPENAEATMDVPFNKVPYLKKAHDGLQEPMTSFLETSTPDWIIYDFSPHWLPPIAAKLNISRAYFSIFNAWSISFLGPTSSYIRDHAPALDPEQFGVPNKWAPFPSNVALRPHEVRRFFALGKENASGVTDIFRYESTVKGCEAYLVRSCFELEPDWLNLLGELHRKPVIPVGLLPPTVQVSGDEKNEAWQRISKWLDKQNIGSVVYIALGSEVTLSQDEVTELALGLELSGLPFFWALRKQFGWGDSNSVELPNGFEDRTKGRGVVCTSWAPQLRILDHEAVGGFLTHCGWSSIIEGLQLGCVLIMLPFLGDQGLNARVFEEREVGVEIPRDEKDGSFTRDSVVKSLRLVMVDEEGRKYRDTAKDMRKIFGDKHLHDRYVDEFVRHLEKHRPIQADY